VAASAAANGGAIAPTPGRRLDAGTVANLALAAPLGTLRATDPLVAATIGLVRDHLTLGDAVVQGVGHVGLSPDLTMQLGLVELEQGDPTCIDRLAWMVEVGGDVVTWPSAVHPSSLGGSAGRPFDPVALARFLTLVRRLTVRELEDEHGMTFGIALCTVVPPRWLGQSIDVRDAPTALGRCSFSVRWHGDRPAVFWEIDPHPGITAARITAPGLDPAWSSDQLHGEALLAPVAVPGELVAPPEPEPPAPVVGTFPVVEPTINPPYQAGRGGREVSIDLSSPTPRTRVPDGDGSADRPAPPIVEPPATGGSFS
jgi:hypothetical protein